MHAELILEGGPHAGRRHVVRQAQTFVLGRGKDASIRLNIREISRHHAQVELGSDGRIYLTDLKSRNGTFHAEQQLTPERPVPLEHGQTFALAEQTIRVEIKRPDEETRRLREQLALEGEPLLEAQGFEIIGTLGSGSYGAVYAAKHAKFDEAVAVKVLFAPLDKDRPEELQRFVREALVCSRIQSPHVLKVYDVNLLVARPYIVMELIHGPSALDRLRGGPLLVSDALRIAEEVAQGLAAVHADGVIHRDVKPANILIRPSGEATLCDFGLAKDEKSAQALTESNVGLGSLAYVSPEQAAQGRTVDPRSDLYSLGATLYHLISGQTVVKPTSPSVLFDIVEGKPEPLRLLRRDCPEDVARLIHAMLEKAPAARPPTAASVARQLHELRDLLYPETIEVRQAEQELQHMETSRIDAREILGDPDE